MPRVVYFSVLRDRLGLSEEEVQFRGSVSKLREFLKEKHPEVADILDRVKFAVNEEYVGEDYNLEGDERVAIIPPVSGG
ncbi:MoaD/ThiS family protein [Hydrogenivirga sp. 128-5-R1-1]|uniref:MoaD/ThiS family protein n=1 Tax=Hydrogenivirga sp. 128-5-R1-1 TaxID=392423 RepID=UPI00015EF7C7|nr:MoaD/ThiS family protein [Hydrogenivirga sp. 128-5-R1-1]EDP75611.1 Molybdopterin converting factor, small subunit [Hydrogenivirga sp. 128-5-R1-1]